MRPPKRRKKCEADSGALSSILERPKFHVGVAALKRRQQMNQTLWLEEPEGGQQFPQRCGEASGDDSEVPP